MDETKTIPDQDTLTSIEELVDKLLDSLTDDEIAERLRPYEPEMERRTNSRATATAALSS